MIYSEGDREGLSERSHPLWNALYGHLQTKSDIATSQCILFTSLRMNYAHTDHFELEHSDDTIKRTFAHYL